MLLQTFHTQEPLKTSKRLTFGQHFSLEHFKPSPQQSKGLTVHSTGKPSQHPASSPHQHLFSLWQGSVTCTDRGRLSSGGGHFCLLTFCFLAVLTTQERDSHSTSRWPLPTHYKLCPGNFKKQWPRACPSGLVLLFSCISFRRWCHLPQ